MENKNQPSNPHTVVVKSDGVSGSPIETIEYLGLTKREYFAGLAMQSMANQWDQNDSTIKECARRSIKIADELLKQLENA